jgi:predicted transposase YbfD/YdcC
MLYIVKKTLEAVKKSKNDAIVQVKENQEKLLKQCQRVESRNEIHDEYEAKVEKGHGRIERRKVTTYEMEAWDGLIKSFVVLERKIQRFSNRKQFWEETFEKSYYAITRYMRAEEAYEGIRQHWFIENRENWVKDVSMGEDACRIKKNAATMGRLRSVSLNQLRRKKVKNVRKALVMNAMDIKQVMKYF